MILDWNTMRFIGEAKIPIRYSVIWTYDVTPDWGRQLKFDEKKRPRELAAALGNLDTFLKTLSSGVVPRQAKFGFIHPEPLGILAIDQKGGGANLAQFRLYVYPDEGRKVLHFLTIGDKNSQKQDINDCRDFVAQLRQEDQKTHEPKKGSHRRFANGKRNLRGFVIQGAL
jgi:hypothetical protein